MKVQDLKVGQLILIGEKDTQPKTFSGYRESYNNGYYLEVYWHTEDREGINMFYNDEEVILVTEEIKAALV